jgi:hypothetical protein
VFFILCIFIYQNSRNYEKENSDPTDPAYNGYVSPEHGLFTVVGTSQHGPFIKHQGAFRRIYCAE